MLSNRLCKIISNAGLRHLSVCSSSRSFTLRCLQNSRNTLFPVTSNFLTRRTHYSDDAEQNYVKLPPLAEGRRLYYPNMFKMFKGMFQVYLIIKPNLDKEFDVDEFLEGSKQALSTVSKALANEDYDSIQGLVTNDVINGLRNKISTLSDEQKHLIALDVEDCYSQFPYEIGIMFDDNKADEKTVEIMVVFYTLKGMKYLKDRLEAQNPMLIGSNPEFKKFCFICNYRFARTFTETGDSSWIINYINQFSPD